MRWDERDSDPLALDGAAMRAYGYRSVDMLVEGNSALASSHEERRHGEMQKVCE